MTRTERRKRSSAARVRNRDVHRSERSARWWMRLGFSCLLRLEAQDGHVWVVDGSAFRRTEERHDG